MESIREIISFSHDGIDQMWYPFSASLDPYNSIISAEYYHEIGELLLLLQSMFATNNHSPELVEKKNMKDARKFLVGEKRRRIECSIIFSTDKNRYNLRRCFLGNHSIEAKLHKVDSKIIHGGDDAIKMLNKFHKPFVITESRLFNSGSSIMKPDNEFSRKTMAALANNWTKMVGLTDSRIELDFAGRWSTLGDVDSFNSKRHSYRTNMPSPLRIFTHLAQAVMRKRKYGRCPPIFSTFNVDALNEFESLAMLDLIKHVCEEESIQFIVAINARPEVNSMVNAITTPRLSVYEKN